MKGLVEHIRVELDAAILDEPQKALVVQGVAD